MEEQKTNNQQKRKLKKSTRIFVAIVIVLLLLILLPLFIIPAFISSQSGNKFILNKINSAVDGRANFSSLSMGWFKGIELKDISYDDNAGQTQLTVKRIKTKPHYVSILAGSISLGETIVEQPSVNIDLEEKQPVQSKPGKSDIQTQSAPPVLPIKKIDLVVKDGSLKITDSESQTLQLANINSKVDLRPPGKRSSVTLELAVVDKAKVSNITASGQIKQKSKKSWSFAGTSGVFTVEVNDLELDSLQPLLSWAGLDLQVKGKLSADIDSTIEQGRFENLNAKINASDLDITGQALKGDRLKTNTLNVDVRLKGDKDTINISTLNIQSDWAEAKLEGVVPTSLESLSDFLSPESTYELNGSFNIDLSQAVSQMPQTFGLKPNTKIISGTLTANVVTSAAEGKRQITSSGKIENLSGLVEGKTVTFTEPITADVRIASDEERIKFERIYISAPFAKIDGSGTAETFEFTADADLAELQNQLGQFVDVGPYAMQGNLSAKGKVDIKKHSYKADGSCVVADLKLTNEQGITVFEPKAKIDYAFDLRKDKSLLELDHLNTTAAFGSLNIKDARIPLEKDKPLNLPVSANLDLQKLQPFAVLFASFPQEMKLYGKATSDISIKFENQTIRLLTDNTRIENLKVTYPDQSPFEQTEVLLTLDAELNQAQKTIDVKELNLTSPQIKIKKATLKKENVGTQTKVQGKADLEYDWQAISTIAAPFLPTGLTLYGKRQDSINFASQFPIDQGDKLLANLNTNAKLGFDKAEYMGLDIGPTEVDMKIQSGVLTIAPFSSTVNNGQLNFACTLDLNAKPPMLKTPEPMDIVNDVQINDKTAKQLLAYVNPVFAKAVNVSGIANFSCEKLSIPLAENKNAIEIIGTISFTDVRLEGSGLLTSIFSVVDSSPRGKDINIHPTRFVLQNGRLSYDDMQMDVGRNPVNFKGVIGLDKTLNMTVVLPYTTRGKTVRVNEPTEGKRIAIALTGTTDDPQIDLGKVLELQIRDQLGEQLEERIIDELEKIFK